MTSPVYPPKMAYRLASIRATLNVRLVVRLSLDEMHDVVHHLESFDMVPAGGQATALDIMRAFRIDRLAVQWDATAGDFQWLLVPDGATEPQGELGGGPRVVALRWGVRGQVIPEDVGTFVPSSIFVSEMTGKCDFRASGDGSGCLPYGTGGFSSQQLSSQN